MTKLLKRKSIARNACYPTIQNLERRLCLSAVLGPDGTLSVTGTSGPDNIEVSYYIYSGQPNVITVAVNNQVSTFDPNAVKAISVSGGDGNDDIVYNLTSQQPVTLDGGNGNDTIQGGSAGPATLLGDAGDDVLYGNGYLSGGEGNDTIMGRPGSTLDGGDGNDTFSAILGNGSGFQGYITVLGGAGNDTLVSDNQNSIAFNYSGGSGIDTYDDSADYAYPVNISLDNIANDGPSGASAYSNIQSDVEVIIGPQAASTIIGDSADNTLIGGGGNDTLIGNGGNDLIEGNAGDDSLTGGPGNDTILGGDGQDTIIGGGGHDVLDGGSGYNVINGVSNSPGGYAYIDPNGVLQVFGTNQQDFIDFTYSVDFQFDTASPNQLDIVGTYDAKVNGTTYAFNSSSVSQIVVNGYNGNDSINVSGYEQNDFGSPAPGPVNILVNDGSGNDSINVDTEEDGFANALNAAAPASTVIAGNGDDNIFVSGSTSSTVNVGNGNDTIGGSASNDDLSVSITAGNGNDAIDGDSAGDAGLGMSAHLGTGQDTLANGDDPDIHVSAYTSGGQFAAATQSYLEVAGTVTSAGKPVAGATVYLDTNNNGKLDAGEPYTTTNANGVYYGLNTMPPDDGSLPSTYGVSIVPPVGMTAYPQSYAVAASPGLGYLNENFTLATPTAAHPVVFGTAGSYRSQGNVAANAVDGNLNTFFDGPDASGDFVALDYGSPQLIRQISYAPRPGFANRMVGGIFQVSNSADFTDAVTLYKITSTPLSGQLKTVSVSSPGKFRYVRYVGPTNGYCNIAEMRFGLASLLTGTPIGTSGSYRNHGTTITNAFDGNLSTFFDGPDASGDWVGLDLGSAQVVTQVEYAPRAGWESRMSGGEIQASNSATFSAGVVTLYRITSVPAAGVLTTQSLSNTTAYRYYRYIGPAGSYCDIAELGFFG